MDQSSQAGRVRRRKQHRNVKQSPRGSNLIHGQGIRDLLVEFLFGLSNEWPTPTKMINPKRSYIGMSRQGSKLCLLWIWGVLRHLDPLGQVAQKSKRDPQPPAPDKGRERLSKDAARVRTDACATINMAVSINLGSLLWVFF